MQTTEKNVPNNIAKLRLERGYSQIEFAEKIGISHYWLNKIENHKESPGLTTVMKIAEGLDVTLNDIFLK